MGTNSYPLPIAHLHDALLGRRFPRHAGEEATEGRETSTHTPPAENCLARELRACGMVTAETVGMETPQWAMIGRECALIEDDELSENCGRKMPEHTNEVAHTCRHALHCTPL